nr:uncharacterized protein LOC116156929 isoform X2 [Camelus dromedarius]
MENIQLNLIYVVKKKKKTLTQPRSKCFKATTRISQVFPSLYGIFALKRKRSRSGRFLPWFTETLAWGGRGPGTPWAHTSALLSLHLPLSLHPAAPGKILSPTSRSPGLSTLSLRCAPYAGPSAAARKRRPRGHKEFRQRSPGFAVCSSSASAQRQSQRCPVRVPLRSSNKLQMIFKPKTRHTHGSCLQSENPMAYHQRMDQSLD